MRKPKGYVRFPDIDFDGFLKSLKHPGTQPPQNRGYKIIEKSERQPSQV
jgi:hypothetical protein